MADASVIFTTDLDESGLRSGLTKLKSSIGTFAKAAGIAIGAVATGLGALAKSALTYNSQMEQYYTSFTTLLGSEEKATAKVAELKEYAASTPFEMTDLAEATKTILSFGVAEEQTSMAMQQLGDISQGNREKFSSLALVYGQMASTGKLMGQDLLQMINAGFNPLTTIADKTGTSIGDLKHVMAGEKTSDAFNNMLVAAQKEVSQLGDDASDSAKMLAEIGTSGQISASLVDDAMRIATSEGGLFYQAMEKQSQTAVGLISTLKDNAKSLLGEVFTGTSEAMKGEALPTALAYIDQLTTAFRSGGTTALVSTFGDILGDLVGKVSAYAPQLIQMSVGLIKALLNGIKSNSKVIAKGLAETFKEAVLGLIALAPDLVDVGLELLIELADSLADELPDIMVSLMDALFNIIVKLVSNAPKLLAAGLKIAAALFEGILTGLTALMADIISMFGVEINKYDFDKPVDIKPTLTDEHQQEITDWINAGIAASQEKVKIEAEAKVDTEGIVAKIESAFADGKLTKKEKNALGDDMQLYVDEAIEQANAYVEAKTAEWETTLSNMVDGDGTKTYTDEEAAALAASAATTVDDLTAELADTYAEYEELASLLASHEHTATAAEIIRLEELAAKVLGIKSQIEEATNDVLNLQNAKIARVERGSGSWQDFFESLGFRKDQYAQAVDDIYTAADERAAANQAYIAAGSPPPDVVEHINENTDAAYTQAAIDAGLASQQYQAEIMALYNGMARGNPEAAAAISNMLAYQKRYAEFSGAMSDLSGMSDSMFGTIQDYLTTVEDQPFTVDQLKTAIANGDESIQTIIREAIYAMQKEAGVSFLTEADTLSDNPLMLYMQQMFEAGAFDDLDLSALDGAFGEALQAIDFAQHGIDGVDGIFGGIDERAGELTEDDWSTLKEKMLETLRTAFDSHSPARVMFPLGEDIVDGLVQGINDNREKVGAIGYSLVSSIVSGIQRNYPSVAGAIRSVVAVAATLAASTAYASGQAIGAALGQGVVAGILTMVAAAAAAAASLVTATYSGARDKGGIHSPSRLFYEGVGQPIGMGTNNGFIDVMNNVFIPNVRKSVSDAAQAGRDAMNGTLLGKVQAISGFNIPNFAGIGNAILRGSLLTGTGSTVNTNNSNSNINYTQYVTFESTMQAPDEIARTLRRQAGYGLAGAKKS